MTAPSRRALLLGLAGAGVAPRAHAASGPRTVRYAQTPGVDANLQSLDLYGAQAGGKRPILAFIHGGGWAFGDKANHAHGETKADCFAPRGFVYASLNYRLSPTFAHPAHVQDVAAALAWLHAHAPRFGGDSGRLFVMGHSAGAHLAALVATDERRLGLHGLKLSALRGIIPLDGAGYDLTREAPTVEARPGPLGKWYRDAFGTDPKVWADASPILHATPGKDTPPFLVFYTARQAARRQSEALAAALRQAGGEARATLAPGKSHAAINRDIGRPGDAVTAQIFAALREWGA